MVQDSEFDPLTWDLGCRTSSRLIEASIIFSPALLSLHLGNSVRHAVRVWKFQSSITPMASRVHSISYSIADPQCLAD